MPETLGEEMPPAGKQGMRSPCADHTPTVKLNPGKHLQNSFVFYDQGANKMRTGARMG